jgi:Holliday junction resolvase
MRRAAKIDANQVEIVTALRKAGATVQSLAAIGAGCPDLLVGYKGVNYLMEVKDGSKPPSGRKLTPDQVEWLGKWKGAAVTVTTLDEAIEILNEKNN